MSALRRLRLHQRAYLVVTRRHVERDSTQGGTAQPSPVQARPRNLPVEGIGRTDRLKGGPYDDLYWYEGKRPGLAWPISLYCFDGAGVVAGAVDETPHAEQAAAAAVDAVRQALSLEIPHGLGRAHRGMQDHFDLGLALREAIASADLALRNRAQASRDPSVPGSCSLLAVAVRSNRAAVAWIGQCACYLYRGGNCSVLTDELQAEPAPEGPGGHVLGEVLRPYVRTFAAEIGDVLALATSGVRDQLLGPSEVGTVVAESSSLEGACERLIVEARMRGSRGTNSVVMLGVGLEGGTRLAADPKRDPLPFMLALRAALPLEAAAQDPVSGLHALLGPARSQPGQEQEPEPPQQRAGTFGHDEPAARASGPAPPRRDGPWSAPGPRPAPVDIEVAPGARPRGPHSRGAKRWLVGLLAVFAIGAGGAGLYWFAWGRGPTGWAPGPASSAFDAGTPTPRGLAAPESTAAPEFAVSVKPSDGAVVASLNEDAPGPIELVGQEQTGIKWLDLFRHRLSPGDSVTIAMPRPAPWSPLFQADGIALHFEPLEEGGVAWSQGTRLADLPRGCAVSIEGARVYLADRRANILLVVKAAPDEESEAAPGAAGAPSATGATGPAATGEPSDIGLPPTAERGPSSSRPTSRASGGSAAATGGATQPGAGGGTNLERIMESATKSGTAPTAADTKHSGRDPAEEIAE